MRLHVVYRTTGAVNRKPRPAWFSKRAALASLLASAAQAETRVDVTYVADGGLPEGTADLVGDSPVVPVRAGRADRSYRRALEVALRATADVREPVLLWVAEDDYVYAPEALRVLAAAADALPADAYLALYVPDNSAWRGALVSQPEKTVPPGPPVEVLGTCWRRVPMTTSTVGVQARTLRADVRQHVLCSWAGSPFDDATHTSLQGLEPYSWRHLTRDLYPRPGLRGRVKVVAKPAMRAVVNLSAHAQRGKGRVLMAPEQDLCTHAEDGFVSPSRDWSALAGAL